MTQERRSVKITIVVSSCEDCPHKGWDQDGMGQCGIDGYGDWLHSRETYSQNSDSPTGLTDSCPLLEEVANQ